jgi:hypothetical protein
MSEAMRDSTEEWLIPASSRPPLIGELVQKVDEALAIARASEAAVSVVGDAALEAAELAGRAAELAESSSAIALEASRSAAELRRSDRTAPIGGPGPAPPTGGPAPEPAADAGPAEDPALRAFVERADRITARLRAVGGGS